MTKSIKILALALGMSAVYTGSVLAAGSEVQGGSINNDVNIQNSDNLATGTASGGFLRGRIRSEANQGVVKIKDSKVRNARITNRATIRNSDNTARRGGRADQGSVIIE